MTKYQKFMKMIGSSINACFECGYCLQSNPFHKLLFSHKVSMIVLNLVDGLIALETLSPAGLKYPPTSTGTPWHSSISFTTSSSASPNCFAKGCQDASFLASSSAPC